MIVERIIHSCLGLTLLLSASACVNLAEQRNQLIAAPVCCQSYAAMPYAKLALPDSRSVKFDATSLAYAFESGKSFFSAFELPAWTGPYEVKIQTAGVAGVLAPRIKILDTEFKPVRTFNANTEMVEFFVNRENRAERYMIIHNDSAQVGSKPEIRVNPIYLPLGGAIIGATEHRVNLPYAPMGQVRVILKPYAPKEVGQIPQ